MPSPWFRWGFCLMLASGSLLGCGARKKEAAPATPAVSPEQEAVAYVGDDACASCHEDLYASYHRTGMGRSVSVFDAAGAPEQFGKSAVVYNAPFNFYYEAFVRGDTLFQREFRRDASGEVSYERIHPVEWVIGSGNATRSYLMNVGGNVTEMPLTWYVKRQKWDMSPAYTQRNFRFERPIGAQCMTCHNGIPAYSTFTEGHFTEVPLGITCERCHGPGEAHVEAHLAGLGPPEGALDPTLVSLGRLDRELQLAVCQQCHLTGLAVFKPGEEAGSYRPGRPLSAHQAVFVPREQLDDPEHFGIASHANRLALSACFQQSEMTCTTCHDPHQPVAELEADHFERVCQRCHRPEPTAPGPLCSRPLAHGIAEAMTGNCVSCHIQKAGTSDIPHVTFTDHWIRRTLPPAKKPEDIDRILVQRDPFTLVRLTEEHAQTPVDSAQAMLEEAAAYFTFYETKHRLPAYLPRVVEKARAGLAAGGEHVEARLALGRALAEQGALEAAEQALYEASVRYPDHARVLYWLGVVRLQAGKAAAAVGPLEQAVAVQPAFNEARLKLAEALQAMQRTAGAQAAFEEVLRRDPIHHPAAWNNLGFLYLQTQRLEEAARHFEQAVALDPDYALAFVNLGSVRLMQQDVEGAVAPLEQALRIDSAYVPALGNLGLVHVQLGHLDEARTLFERLLVLQPGDARARAMLEQLRQPAE